MSALLNGPITLGLVVAGAVLNVLTIYVLSAQTLPRQRASLLANQSPNLPKRLSGSTFDRSRSVMDLHNSQRRRINRSQSQAHSHCGAMSRPRVYTFFLWLTVADILLLLSALLLYSVPNMLQNNIGAYVHFFPYFYLLSNAALIASVWLMCALMLDRYWSLCRPFAVRGHNILLVHKVLFAVSMSALLFSLPRFFELDSVLDRSTDTYYVTQTELVHNKLYMIGYRIVGGLLFYSLLPYVLLFVLSFRVWLVIRKAAIARIKMNASGSMAQTCATDSEMILIAVISKFLLSRLLPTLLDVVEHLVGPDVFTRSSELTICVDVSNLVVVCTAGINLLIFCGFSAAFRKAVAALLVRGRRRARLHSPLSPTSTLSALPPPPPAKPRIPRQLSLQADRKRNRPLRRKTTVTGLPCAQVNRSVTIPRSAPAAEQRSPLMPHKSSTSDPCEVIEIETPSPDQLQVHTGISL